MAVLVPRAAVGAAVAGQRGAAHGDASGRAAGAGRARMPWQRGPVGEERAGRRRRRSTWRSRRLELAAQALVEVDEQLVLAAR